MTNLSNSNAELLSAIRHILNDTRTKLQTTVNNAMVQTYWNVGQVIVEYEQHGEKRADYGSQILKELSQQLKSEFGKGFDERNL